MDAENVAAGATVGNQQRRSGTADCYLPTVKVMLALVVPHSMRSVPKGTELLRTVPLEFRAMDALGVAHGSALLRQQWPKATRVHQRIGRPRKRTISTGPPSYAKFSVSWLLHSTTAALSSARGGD